MIWHYIKEHNLRDKVRFAAQIHDENLTKARVEYAPIWKIEMGKLMEAAAKFSIPTGLLKSDTSVSEVWTK